MIFFAQHSAPQCSEKPGVDSFSGTLAYTEKDRLNFSLFKHLKNRTTNNCLATQT